MATQEQIRRIFQKMRESHPKEFFHHMDETQAGIGAVLRLLYIEKKPVTAGKISDTLGISTARVAVLLRKMESRGLIIKEKNPLDARVTIVRLTDITRLVQTEGSTMSEILTAGGKMLVCALGSLAAAVATLSDLLSVAQPGSPKKGIEIEMFQRPAIFFFDE